MASGEVNIKDLIIQAAKHLRSEFEEIKKAILIMLKVRPKQKLFWDPGEDPGDSYRNCH